MSVSAIVGMQWGDEGKGKIVDALSESVDLVVRCQGGANAGHTVVLGKTVFKLHVVPSGILREGVRSVVGNGVVFDPARLVAEIEGLEAMGIGVEGRLYLSDRAHMVLPYHQVLDGLQESSRGTRKIGTTGRGIGPAYADKAARLGLRAHDLLDEERFLKKLRELLSYGNRRIEVFGGEALDVAAHVEKLRRARGRLAPFVADTVSLLHEAYGAGKDILLEGAQGTQLDIDFGTYPFVTSSNTTGGGFCTGSGLPPSAVDRVHGVFKAFTTRVGEGPFVTEASEEESARLRGTGDQQWDEYGTTTGRPRRCGWCDLVLGRYAARVNGVTNLHITKLDVLSGLATLPLCTGYELDGRESHAVPADIDALSRAKPLYETLPGWSEPLAEIRAFDELPAAARGYVRRIFEEMKMSSGTVSVGPRRDQIVPVPR
ncbi:MAG: adenylosuccinate synthase [Planctomycetota bacterium]